MDIPSYISSGAIESYVLGLSDAAEIAEINALRLEYPQIEAAIQDFEKSIEKLNQLTKTRVEINSNYFNFFFNSS